MTLTITLVLLNEKCLGLAITVQILEKCQEMVCSDPHNVNAESCHHFCAVNVILEKFLGIIERLVYGVQGANSKRCGLLWFQNLEPSPSPRICKRECDQGGLVWYFCCAPNFSDKVCKVHAN